MRVIAVSAKWCNKCKEAKTFLDRYDMIEWIDLDSNIEGMQIMEYFDEEHIPFFVIEDFVDHKIEVINTFKSYRKLAKWIEEISSK